MNRLFLIITILLMCMLGISCVKSTEVTNNAEHINNSRETRPPPPTGRYAEGEEDALYERLYFRVESELQKYVVYDVTDKKNLEKNILFLLEHYETIDLDILDSADYIVNKSCEYKDDIDDNVHEKIYAFEFKNESVMNELTGQAKMGHGHITEYLKSPSPID